MLKELRSKFYAPWKEKQWNTSHVAHDNPPEVQLQASVMRGFADEQAVPTFFKRDESINWSQKWGKFCAAIHAYIISFTLTFIKDGSIISP